MTTSSIAFRSSCLTATLLLLNVLSSCSAPPRPPAVNYSTRRPANATPAVDLQTCQSELTDTTLQLHEAARDAEAASVAAARRVRASAASAATSSAPSANSLYIVHFDFASTQIVAPPDSAAAMLAEARKAPLIVLCGRTDGPTETLAESRVARERATTVRDYLVSAGIDPNRIRTTYQPIGDAIADNTDPMSRTANRRVEIEVYRAMPVARAPINAVRP